MIRCVICSNTITNGVSDLHRDSAEHVFPNAIGGRKTISGFICNKCNSETGETWDAALAKSMQPFGILFDIERDRGEVPPLRILTTQGERVTLQAGGGMAIADPEFRKLQRPDGSLEYNIKARTIEEMHRMLEGLKKRHPDLDIEATLAEATTVEKYLDGDIQFTFEFGGPEGGRSMVKTCLAFAFSKGVGWDQCENATAYLRNPNAKACFGYFSARDLVSGRKSGVPLHCVALRADPTSGLVLSYAEYFGVVRIVACLGEKYAGPPIEFCYAFDPRTGEDIKVKVLLYFNRQQIEDVYDYIYVDGTATEAALSAVFAPVLQEQVAAERTRVINNAVDKAFDECGAKEGEHLTEKHIRRICLSIAESVVPFMRHRMRPVQRPNKSGRGKEGA